MSLRIPYNIDVVIKKRITTVGCMNNTKMSTYTSKWLTMIIMMIVIMIITGSAG